MEEALAAHDRCLLAQEESKSTPVLVPYLKALLVSGTSIWARSKPRATT
jgi:hypothetical protein